MFIPVLHFPSTYVCIMFLDPPPKICCLLVFLLRAWVRGTIRHPYVYMTWIEHISWNESTRSGKVSVAATCVLQLIPWSMQRNTCMCYETFRSQSVCSHGNYEVSSCLYPGQCSRRHICCRRPTKEGRKEGRKEQTNKLYEAELFLRSSYYSVLFITV